nr:type ISP restriction/modification enzyme [uncultured Fluviicola sp.]
MGNPPYSVGQKSANDIAQNQKYVSLDSRIEQTYAKGSKATSVKALYDSYIKAFRWSSDRLDPNGGIICFVSNGAWIDGNGMDGLRKSLENEFSSIYIFNLRGNQRTSGELSRKEGGKVFGSGSRTPISITLLVKNTKDKKDKATIYYHDIGDYLSREEKLKILKDFGSFDNQKLVWKTLSPNEHGDWINERNDIYGTFIPSQSDKKFELNTNSFFITHSLGLATGRDAWVLNFSKNKLSTNVKSSIEFFNTQSEGFLKEKSNDPKIKAESFIDTNPNRISWNRNFIEDIEKHKLQSFDDSSLTTTLYRPFVKSNLYFHKDLNAMLYQNKRLFPNNQLENKVICVTGISASRPFSVLLTDVIPNLDTLEKSQCFPLYYYEQNNSLQKGLFDDESESEYIRKDGISDFILERAKKQYGKNVSKEDLFYYVYGFLHNREYRELFANDLKKMLPRLPLIEDVKDFWAFSNAGRKLAELHLNYETVPAYFGVDVSSFENGKGVDSSIFKIEKMRFPKKDQKNSIIYNSKITISNIPDEAYEYVVNGKSAIEWIMERYAVTTHKDSGITNDPNDWADDIGNPKYILDLLLSIINVSVQTVEIVKGLPKVKFDDI